MEKKSNGSNGSGTLQKGSRPIGFLPDLCMVHHGALSRIAPLHPLPSFTCSHNVLSRTWKGFHWDWPLSRCERKQRLLLAENRLQARWRDEEADCVLFDFA